MKIERSPFPVKVGDYLQWDDLQDVQVCRSDAQCPYCQGPLMAVLQDVEIVRVEWVAENGFDYIASESIRGSNFLMCGQCRINMTTQQPVTTYEVLGDIPRGEDSWKN